MHALGQHGLGPGEVVRVGALEVLRAAGHQARAQAHRLHGAGLVGDAGKAAAGMCRQRRVQRAQAKHLRRLRQPAALALQRGRHAPAFGALERVGQRQRKQAADGVVQAGIDQRAPPGDDAGGRCVQALVAAVDDEVGPGGHMFAQIRLGGGVERLVIDVRGERLGLEGRRHDPAPSAFRLFDQRPAMDFPHAGHLGIIVDGAYRLLRPGESGVVSIHLDLGQQRGDFRVRRKRIG